MRHRKKLNHLSRKAPHRKAMLANMASSLIKHKRITTTTAKAKALRTFVEPVITRSKEDTTHSRRIAFRHLRDKEAVSELFREVAGKVGERPGGYTRIIKLGNRLGDNADICIIELVDYNENLLAEKAATRTKSSRRRRGGKKKAAAGEEVRAEAAAEVEETPEETAEVEVTDTSAIEEAEVEGAAEPDEPEAKAEEAKAEPAKPEAKDEPAEPEAKADEDSEEKSSEKDEEKKE